jgi:hypothetical protein
MDKKPKKPARIELTPEQKKHPRQPSGDEADAEELKVNELEERVTPRPIGTFF